MNETYRGRPKNSEDRKEYEKQYYKKRKFNRDKLFVILANPDARTILQLMKNGEVCTYTQMLVGFNKDGKNRGGLFAHNIRNLLALKVIIKDKETGFYWLSVAGKLALKGSQIIEKALDEKTLNDVNKQGKLVMKIER